MNSTEVGKNAKRAANFSSWERELLVAIISKYKEVFCGRSDNSSRFSKTKMWEQVHTEFNAEARGCARSLKSLQVFWKNIKKRTKDVEGAIRRQRYVTGGGPPVSIPVDRIHESVKDFMGPAAEGMDNPFDSDGQNLQRLNEVNELEDEGELIETNSEPSLLLNGDWSRGSPALLRTLVCPLLQPVDLLVSSATTNQESTATAAVSSAATPATVASAAADTPASVSSAATPATGASAAANTPAARWCSRRRPRIQQTAEDARVKTLLAMEQFYNDENKRKQEWHDKEMELQKYKIFAMQEENKRQEEMHAVRMMMLKRNM